jgi:ABC-type multidrug transport system ATPase subunit
MTDVLRFAGVSKSFGRARVLADVALAVMPGDRIHLRGVNGAGKTTLLRLAAGVSRPTAGHVRTAGGDVHRDARARRHVSFVPADAPLYGELTPAEHLRWWRGMRGLPRDADDLARLAQAGLARQAHVVSRGLSRGQRQRVALVMGLLPDADVLLLDEPATALDDAGRAWLAAALAAQRGAVVMASHGDTPSASGEAWRTMTIRGGRVA